MIVNKIEYAIKNGFKVAPTYRHGICYFDISMPNGNVVKGKKGIVPSARTKRSVQGSNIQSQMKIIYEWLYDKHIAK